MMGNKILFEKIWELSDESICMYKSSQIKENMMHPSYNPLLKSLNLCI